MRVPIVGGIRSGSLPELRPAWPVNLAVEPIESGFENGFLRPADGICHFADGHGIDRGGIVWKNEHYRVMGGQFVRVGRDGSIESLGEVGNLDDRPVKMDYGFDRLAIAADGRLFYFDGKTLEAVTDETLGEVLDVVWVDGYFMTTDGEYLVVSELNDPTTFSPTDYGSSEASPDPVVALLKVRNEIAAVNRHTIEIFDNAGAVGDSPGFPFQRQENAQIQKGAISRSCCAVLHGAIVFLGGGINEPIALWATGADGQASRISNDDIDRMIGAFSEKQLAKGGVEALTILGHDLIDVHLPDKTLRFDMTAAEALKKPALSVLADSIDGFSQYRARHLTFAQGQWIAGDPSAPRLGVLTRETGDRWGEPVRWEFSTPIIYPDGQSAIVHSLELVSLTGRQAATGAEWRISVESSDDGASWSQKRFVDGGRVGDRGKRVQWRRLGMVRHWRVFRFSGDSRARMSFIRLEAELEALHV